MKYISFTINRFSCFVTSEIFYTLLLAKLIIIYQALLLMFSLFCFDMDTIYPHFDLLHNEFLTLQVII